MYTEINLINHLITMIMKKKAKMFDMDLYLCTNDLDSILLVYIIMLCIM